MYVCSFGYSYALLFKKENDKYRKFVMTIGLNNIKKGSAMWRTPSRYQSESLWPVVQDRHI